MLRPIGRLIAALVIGLIISVWIIQRNDQVQRALTSKLLGMLEKEWSSKITAEYSKINFFTSSIYIKNGLVTSLKHKNCYWKAREAKIYISPLALMFGSKVRLSLTLLGIDAKSGLENDKLEIQEHLENVFKVKNSGLDIKIQAVHIGDINFNVVSPYRSVKMRLNGFFDLVVNESIRSNKGKAWHANFVLDDGKIVLNDTKLLSKISLKSHLFKNRQDSLICADIICNFNVAMFDKNMPCKLDGKWHRDSQNIVIQDLDNKLNLKAVKNNDSSFHVSGLASLPVVVELCCLFGAQNGSKPSWLDNLSGEIGLDVNIKYDKFLQLTDGLALLRNVKYKNVEFKSAELRNASFDGNNFKSDVLAEVNDKLSFDGVVDWSKQSKLCNLSFSNSKLIKFSKDSSSDNEKNVNKAPSRASKAGLVIEPGCINVKGRVGSDFVSAGAYSCVIADQEMDRRFSYKGGYLANAETIKTTGKTDHGEYNIEATIKPSLHISKWIYEVGEKKFIDLSVRDGQDRILSGSVRYTLIRSFLDQQVKQFFIGKQCVFHIAVDQKNLQSIKGQISLGSGKFYLPQNRNLVKKVYSAFNIDILNKKLTCLNSGIDFCKGRVFCPQLTVSLNEDNHLEIVHVPLQVDDLLVNWKRDLYALVYGTVLVNKLPGKAIKVTGDVILKSSLLKDNLFAGEGNFNIYSPLGAFGRSSDGIVFDFHVTNEKPIKVKTSSLEVEANLDLKVLYSQNSFGILLPRVSGSINLEKGYLKFLKNKLNIDYGRVLFLANQINDPTIDLIARNRINKYLITLQTTGTLQKPTIILDSNPDLSEEQILSLLLGGSENASLQTDLPAMLMQNINTLVLGSRRLQPRTSNLFEKITKPLKYVQISPNFTDQSGRGGVKGVVSVDLNKQLHAQIQKNFTLQEDWDLQVEYMLSDDINIKGVRDQRGEVGAEVEVRLKL